MDKPIKTFLQPLTVERLVAWVEAHHAATGRWPHRRSGPIAGRAGESWWMIDRALRLGLAGLPGGTNLRYLIANHRGLSPPRKLLPLTIKQVLGWAKAYRRAHGRWPCRNSGLVESAPQYDWRYIDDRLIRGGGGLAGGITLCRLLNSSDVPPSRRGSRKLRVKQILTWADAYYEAHGRLPTVRSGRVDSAPSESWANLNLLLRSGRRGLPSGWSLSRVLRTYRPERHKRFRVEAILAWADAHHAATGQWPTYRSGRVSGAPSHLTWNTIDDALRRGRRKLVGGQSLAALLLEHRQVTPRRSRYGTGGPKRKPRELALSIEQILAWADVYHRACGDWPDRMSGRVAGSPGRRTWGSIDRILRQGKHGVTGGSSLDGLLAEQRGVRNRPRLPNLTVEQILAWADAHRAATNHSPTWRSGPVREAPGEDWRRIANALGKGERGLPWGWSLSRLLEEHRPPGRSAFTPEETDALIPPHRRLLDKARK